MARNVRTVLPSASEDALRRGVPGQPFATVQRERLEDALDHEARHALTTVTGPAGSGKTVLLAGWAATSGAGWLSLRPEHIDVARLWRDLAAALQEVGIDLASRPRPAAALPDGATRDIREALDHADGPAVLVLDDLHVLRGAALLLVSAIAAECGDALHLVVASRSDPDLALGRMRVEGRLGELRATDLAFTPPEADALLAEHGLALRSDQTERLVERTEGWAAGLRLAALSLQREDDPETLPRRVHRQRPRGRRLPERRGARAADARDAPLPAAHERRGTDLRRARRRADRGRRTAGGCSPTSTAPGCS